MKHIKLLTLAFVYLFLSACSRIDTGNVGVVSSMGQVDPVVLDAGWHLTGFKSVTECSAKQVTMPFQDFKAQVEGVTLEDFDVDIVYQIAPEKMSMLFTALQGDKVFDNGGDCIPAWNMFARNARSIIYETMTVRKLQTLQQDRRAIETNIKENLQKELNRLYASTFTIVDVNVRALVADRRLEASARKAMENANNTAAKEAEKALAVAEAERLKIAAEGEATANRILSSSLTPQLLELKRLEAQKAFAGQGTHTVLMPANASANVFVGK